MNLKPTEPLEPSPAHMQTILRDVDALLEEIVTLDPRDFEAAVARGEAWAYEKSREVWLRACELENALFPRNYHDPPPPASDRHFPMWGWPPSLSVAMVRLIELHERWIARWEVPELYRNLREARRDPSRTGTPAPVIELAEVGALRWISGELHRGMPSPAGEPTAGPTGPDDDDDEWGPEIPCSKRKLRLALGFSRGNAKAIEQSIAAGKLRLREVDNPENGYEKYRARIKDPARRIQVLDYFAGRPGSI